MAGSAVLAMFMNAIFTGKIRDITLLIDEIKDFSPYLLPGLLSESRKYGLRIIIASQYINQMNRELFDSIMGNVSWIAAFRVSPDDALRLSKKFSFEHEKIERTLISLPDGYCLMKDQDLRIHSVKGFENNPDKSFIDDSYLNYGLEVDTYPQNVLPLIYSMQERDLYTNFISIYREYREIFHGDLFSRLMDYSNTRMVITELRKRD